MSQIILGGRGSGRTTRLVEMLKADPHGVLITLSEVEAKLLRRRYDLTSEQVVSCQHVVNWKTADEHRFYIDDADRLLVFFLRQPGLSLTAMSWESYDLDDVTFLPGGQP